ncbi:MAG: hypothetical protein JXB06_09240 [Spirochaetales bacterium]|nr:hypothetical protein [Spirochaetales bacterium]
MSQSDHYTKLCSSPGGDWSIFTRRPRILLTSSDSVITARIRIGELHRQQVKAVTSYT